MPTVNYFRSLGESMLHEGEQRVTKNIRKATKAAREAYEDLPI